MADYALHIKAYARKASMGGGFAGKVTFPRQPGETESRFEKQIFSSYEEARDWSISKAHDLMCGRNYRRCSVNRGSSGFLYEAFIYVY